ncbi:GWxTD domain-containing protein [Acidobacteriota bacterium]
MRFALIFKERHRIIASSFAIFSIVFIGSSLLFISSSCSLYKAEQELDPEYAEFISKVRYIVTKKERRIFLELPNSERDAFMEEFWDRRDPDPGTEENEFKMEYFNRMDRADELFVSEGVPGWMTDRGRIYILFGPPMERITDPMGTSAYSACQEVWYYGSFPVVFVDSRCSGNYHLLTYNLSSMRSLNLMYMHEMGKAQFDAQQTLRSEKRMFDFEWSVEKRATKDDRIEGTIFVEVPYSSIWFTSEDEMLVTVLDLHLELKNFEEKIIWEHDEAVEIKMKEDKLEENKRGKHKVEIPFIMEVSSERISQGKNLLYGSLTNRTGGEKAAKVKKFN